MGTTMVRELRRKMRLVLSSNHCFGQEYLPLLLKKRTTSAFLKTEQRIMVKFLVVFLSVIFTRADHQVTAFVARQGPVYHPLQYIHTSKSSLVEEKQRKISPFQTKTLHLPLHRKLVILRGGGIASAAKALSAHIGSSKANCWIVLFISILGDTLGVCLSKYARDHGSVKAFVCSIIVFLATLCGFNVSLSHLEVGVAYAVWGALGTLIVSAQGYMFFKETYDPIKLACLLLITIGVLGLNLRDHYR
jgi:small multidrug resistance pump